MTLELSAGLSRSPLVAPLLDGHVPIQGIELTTTRLDAGELFWRQLHHEDFDMSDLSLASLAVAVSRGNTSWVALPVFPTRAFFHLRLHVRADSELRDPRQLVGKRVGIADYQQTAAVWCRGVLARDFGVTPDQITWVMERPPRRSHGEELVSPPGVTIELVDDGRSIRQLLRSGEIDAAMWGNPPKRNLIDPDPASVPVGGTRPLFERPTEQARYWAAHSLLPANHCLVVRREIAERHRWAVLNIYSAFVEAKRKALEDFRGTLRSASLAVAVPAELESYDPAPYGLEAERPMLETLLAMLQEQALLARPVTVAELFAPAFLSL